MNHNPCNCGSVDLSELNPYGVETVRCNECNVSLRKQDWNRIMCRSEYHKSLSCLYAQFAKGTKSGSQYAALRKARDTLDEDRSACQT